MVLRTSTLGIGLLAIVLAGTIFTFYWISSQTQDSFVLNSAQLEAALGESSRPSASLALDQCLATLESASHPSLVCPSLSPTTLSVPAPQVAGDQIEAPNDSDDSEQSARKDGSAWVVFAISYLISLIK